MYFFQRKSHKLHYFYKVHYDKISIMLKW